MEGVGGEWGGGVGMVGTDGGGMEETDGGVLDLVAICCCLLVVHQHRHTSLLPPCSISWPCCHPALLSWCRFIVVHPVSQWGRLGGRWDGGTYLESTRRTMNVVCHCGCHVTVGDVAPALPASCRWSFPSVGSCFHPWVVIFTCGQSFAFIVGCFHSRVLFSYICIHGRSFMFMGGHLHS